MADVQNDRCTATGGEGGGVAPGFQIVGDDLTNEVERPCGLEYDKDRTSGKT